MELGIIGKILLGLALTLLMIAIITSLNTSIRSAIGFKVYCNDFELDDYSAKLSSLIDSDVVGARRFYSESYQDVCPPDVLKISNDQKAQLFCCSSYSKERDMICGTFSSKLSKKVCSSLN